jgi:DNA-binding transcriptional regulator YdaS (Cro superfamily)
MTDDAMARIRARRGLVGQIATFCGLTRGAVWKWRQVPAERVAQVEAVTGIPRHELRPDICPPPATISQQGDDHVSTDAQADDYLALATATAVGDVRDHILEQLRNDHDPLPWSFRTEAKQREVVDRVTRFARALVDKLCSMVAAQGLQAAPGKLVRLTTRNGVEMTIHVSSTDPLRHELMDRVGGPVMIVLSQAEEMSGERSPVRIRRDQGDMLDAAE